MSKIKTTEEILRENTKLFQEEPFVEMYSRDTEAIMICMEAYHAQYEGVCEWKKPPFAKWRFPSCWGGEPFKLFEDENIFIYCPKCGCKIKRV
jgi:hypothetical protein